MIQFNLIGCNAAEINNLTIDDLYSTELTADLYEADKAERRRLKGLIQNRANKLGIGAEYKEYLSDTEDIIDDYNDSEEFTHQTSFGLDGWAQLNCGQWIADRKGIRKRISKTFASFAPIQPVEILENYSTGTEKVKLQYYKNEKTRYLITERNSIASRSNIVRLASNGIEVTSENAGQLVSYLSDVINLNPLPYSTAYSQMGWHGDYFLPYDNEIVFDGEETNRHLYKSFSEKGDFETWRSGIEEYRKNICIRISMAASFASVVLDRIGALPFVFHLWGKSGTGKTVALMIAMSIWGNPEMGATVRTLNMTQNAMLGQASFLNSLPFAGDELQTIKDKHENYDKLIMKCTEGIDRGRMLDGQRAAVTKRWKCAFLFTGEDKCTRPNSGAGVKNRCIEVEIDSELLNGTGNSAVALIENNYGHAGKMFIDKLRAIDSELLRTEYNETVSALAEFAGTELKQAAAMAVMILADKIARELFWAEEKPLEFRDVIPYMATSEEIDISERAYSFIIDTIAKNRARFCSTDENHGEIWGGFKGNTVYFNSTELKRQLQREGFEFTSVARAWGKRGYILKAKDGRSTISTTIEGIRARYIAIVLPDDPDEDETDYDGIEI